MVLSTNQILQLRNQSSTLNPNTFYVKSQFCLLSHIANLLFRNDGTKLTPPKGREHQDVAHRTLAHFNPSLSIPQIKFNKIVYDLLTYFTSFVCLGLESQMPQYIIEWVALKKSTWLDMNWYVYSILWNVSTLANYCHITQDKQGNSY